MSQDQAYPYAGNPRQFLAVAMPNGDARFGVEGPLVFLAEKRGDCADHARYLSRAEAEGLRDELNAALRSLVLADELGPIAARDPYPFRDHRTLAEQEPSHAV